MNGHHRAPRVRFLARVLEEIVVLVPGCDDLDHAVAALVVEIETLDAEPRRVELAWNRALAALARADGGCAGGPLPALVFNDMVALSHVNRGPVDLCLALAIEQALVLLPRSEAMDDAVEVLVQQTDLIEPDELEIWLARGTVSEVLQDMVSSEIGGVLAVLLLEWLRNRAA